MREGRLQCKSSVSRARSSSLLQLPVLGGDWWEGQVEQEKAETGASTINVSFRKKKLGIQRILL